MTKKQSKQMGKQVSKQVGMRDTAAARTKTNADSASVTTTTTNASRIQGEGATEAAQTKTTQPPSSSETSTSRNATNATHSSSSQKAAPADAPSSKRRHVGNGAAGAATDKVQDDTAGEKKANVSESPPKKSDHSEEEGDEDEDCDEEDEDDPTAAEYLPFYLQRFVQHYHNEVFVTPYCDKRLVSQLMVEGFLPIATHDYVLPKLHRQRCVVSPENLHVPKSTKKKAKRFLLSINQDFEGVVAGCHRQHGTNWLYDHITEAFRQIHAAGTTGVPAFCFHAQLPPSALSAKESQQTVQDTVDKGVQNDNDHDDNDDEEGNSHGIRRKRPSPSSSSSASSSSSSSSQPQSRPSSSSRKQRRAPSPDPKPKQRDSRQPLGTTPVRLYSVEVYNAETDELVAGELGYTVGDIYTSLTGFSAQDSAGSVQLSALGVLLHQLGFGLWDLGMYMTYKEKLGAALLERPDFVQRVWQARSLCCTLTEPATERSPCPTILLRLDGKRNCKDLLAAA